MTILGIDNISNHIKKLKGKRIGLLTNATGINSKMELSPDVLIKNGINLVALFGPEHGIWGAAPDGIPVKDTIDPRFNIPVYSLYGKTKRPTSDMLSGIDVIIYDIQDVGLRFYTYIYSLAYMMEECGKRGIKVIIFDRPNPLSGKISGPIVKDKKFSSFVGGYDLTLRYGLTIGEIGRYYNDNFKMGVELEVIPMEGWNHNMYYDETGLLWNTPSPAIPCFENALLYSGMCLFEGTNISLGRGTSHPFKYIGAPWIDARNLIKKIKESNYRGLSVRERDFMPYSSRYKNKICHGIELFVTDKRNIEPIEIAIDLISTIRSMHKEMFKWDTAYHEAKGRHHFDLLMGSDIYRKEIEKGKRGAEISQIWEKDIKNFKEKVGRYYIYE